MKKIFAVSILFAVLVVAFGPALLVRASDLATVISDLNAGVNRCTAACEKATKALASVRTVQDAVTVVEDLTGALSAITDDMKKIDMSREELSGHQDEFMAGTKAAIERMQDAGKVLTGALKALPAEIRNARDYVRVREKLGKFFPDT